VLDIIKTYWPIFLTCVSLISLVIQTLLVKTYAKREEVASLGGEVAVLGSRLMLVEKRIEDLPSERELHRLQLEISDLRGELRAVSPQLVQLRSLADLLLENELKDKA
jgi:predicted  nucleic acid-binding Zn-ribbon protein